MSPRYRQPARRAVKRESLWFAVPAAVTTLTGSTLIYQLNAAALALRPFTIVRTIMDFMVTSDQAGAVETQALAFGFSVVSDQAAAIGHSAVPTPVTDLSSDLWMFHRWLYCNESALTDRTTPACVYHSESKAMRKVVEGEQFVGTAELSGATGSILHSAGRILIKLH